MAVQTYNLGVITAYGDAVAGGYTGTKEEWQTLMADYATVGQQTSQDAQTASTAAQTATTKASEASADATRAVNAANSINLPDTTLTQTGIAAEAEVTGNLIRSLQNDVQSIFTRLSELESRNYVYFGIDSFVINTDADRVITSTTTVTIPIKVYNNGSLVTPTSINASAIEVEMYDGGTGEWDTSYVSPAQNISTSSELVYTLTQGDRMPSDADYAVITVVQGGNSYVRNIKYTVNKNTE